MEGGAQKRRREEEALDRSCTAGPSERTAETATEAVKSAYRGVQYDSKNNRWRSRLHTDRTRHVGYYATEEEAARAWDQAALRFSYDVETLQRLNFRDESFAKFKEFVEDPGPIDRFLPELKGVEKRALDTAPPMVVYVASILNNRSMQTIGEFFSARDAAKAYDWKCIEKGGWGSLTNFPLSNYEQECVTRGGHSGLDNSVMPCFPSGKRFASSRKALNPLAVESASRDVMEPAVVSGIQGGIIPDASVQSGAANPVAFPSAEILEMNAQIMLSQFAEQKLQQQLGGDPLGQLGQLGQLAHVAELSQLSQLSQLRVQGIDMPLMSSALTPLNSEPKNSPDVVAVASGTANLATAVAPVSQPVPASATVALPTVPSMTAAMSSTTHEALAQVSLGTFDDVKLAQEAMDRAGPIIKGVSRLTEAEHRKHVELVHRSQAKLQDKIKDKNGEFHVGLKILGKSFELGPYQTVQEARMAHDKYSMVLHGASAQTFNTTIDVLLPKEESESLLFALNRIRSGRTPPPEEPAVSVASGQLGVASEIPQSSLVANAFTSTLRRVASQTSLLDDAADLNKQLENIGSSVGKVANILDKASPFASHDVNPPCPLPAFPGVPQSGLNT